MALRINNTPDPLTDPGEITAVKGPELGALSTLTRPGGLLGGPLTRRAVGFAGAMLKSDLARLVAELPDFAVPGAGEATRQKMELLADRVDQLTNTGTATDQIAGIVGKEAPDLILNISGWNAMRSLGVRGMGALAATPRAMKLFPEAAPRVAGKVASLMDPRLPPVPTPKVLQVAEVLSGSAGVAATEIPLRLAKGEGLPEAMRGAALEGLYWGGTEAGIRAGAKILFRGAREIKAPATGLHTASKAEAHKAILQTDRELKKIAKETETVLGVNAQLEAIIEAGSVAKQMKRHGLAFGPIGEQVLEMAQAAKVAAPKLKAGLKKVDTLARREAKATTRRTALTDFATNEAGFERFVNDAPVGADRPPLPQAVVRAAWEMFGTPEGLARYQGPAAARAIAAADNAGVDSFIGKYKSLKKLREWNGRLMPEDHKNLSLAGKVYEEAPAGGGVDAVRAQFGPYMAAVFQSVETEMTRINAALLAAGGKKVPGAPNMLPHVLLDPDPRSILTQGVNFLKQRLTGKVKPSAFEKAGIDYLVKHGPRMSHVRAQATMQAAIEKARRGPRRFANQDMRGVLPGTLKDKVDAGLPFIENPLEAAAVYIQEAEHKLALVKRFGWNGELVKQYTNMAAKEGADSIWLDNTLKHMLGFNSYGLLMENAARVFTNLQVAGRMTYAVIPNMFQPLVNNPLWFGLRGTATPFLKSLMKDNKKVEVDVASGLLENWYRVFQETMVHGERQLGVSGHLANFSLYPTGFAVSEKFNRWLTSNGAYYWILDSLAKAGSGRLRGHSLEFTRRRFADAGLDLAKIMKQGPENWLRDNPDDVLRAIFKATRRTQIIPTAAIRPSYWSSPWGRIFFQFGTFAMNQGRLIRDTVFNELGKGNPKPLAYFLGVHPVVGESIAEIRRSLLGKERRELEQKNLIFRGIGDITQVGSLGMAQSMWISSRNAGWRGLTAFGGPTVAFADEALRDVFSGDMKGLVSNFVRLPAVDAGLRLLLLGDALTSGGDTNDSFEALGNRIYDAEEADEAVPLSELRTR